MPVHGEFRMLAAQARLARDAGVPADRIVLAENGSVVELRGGIARLTDQLVGSTFVDGLGVGDVKDVALRDRRHLSEDGVLIVVATVGFQNGGEIAAPEVISRGFAETDSVLEEAKLEAERTVEECLRPGRARAEAAPGAHPRQRGQARRRAHRPPADDPPCRRRGLQNSFQNDASPSGCDGRSEARTQGALVTGSYGRD